jgi:hypothetical protein
MPEEGIIIEACSNRKNLPITKVIGTSWHNSNKLFMVRMCLLLIVGFVGCEGILEYVQLRQVNAANIAVINNYAKTLGTLSKQYKDLNNVLTTAKLGHGITDSTLGTPIQQLAGKNVSGQVAEFTSYSELINWLNQDDTHLQAYSTTFQCVDFATMMSEHAIAEGYWIFPAVDLSDGHMKCMATIGENVYAIEPQTNMVSLWAVKSTP